MTMMTSPPSPKDRESFYAAAIVGLHALDARERAPRRFGPDADARWAQFAGALGAGDRIDILLRDAAGTWGAAFSPSETFTLFGLADDEPFGPDWSSLPDGDAKRLIAQAARKTSIDELAQVLGVTLAPIATPTFTTSTRVAVAGGAALVAVAKAFEAAPSLSWTDQVVVVSTKPSFRQLAGLVAVILGARGRTAIVRPNSDVASALRTAGFPHVDVAVVAEDAEPEAADFARTAGGQ